MNKNREKSAGSKAGTVLGNWLANLSRFLTMLFCVLRACDVIDWQWYWVISPTIIAWAIAFVMFALAGILTVVVSQGED